MTDLKVLVDFYRVGMGGLFALAGLFLAALFLYGYMRSHRRQRGFLFFAIAHVALFYTQTYWLCVSLRNRLGIDLFSFGAWRVLFFVTLFAETVALAFVLLGAITLVRNTDSTSGSVIATDDSKA